MHDVSARFLDAVRRPHTIRNRATHKNLVTGVLTPLKILADDAGGVTDDATSNVRRTVSLSTPNEQATWDALDTVGGELAIGQAIRYVDGSAEWVPLGVFVVDVDEMGYGPGDTLQLTSAPDRWGKVQQATLPPNQRASVPTNPAWQEIKRLVEGAWSSPDYPFPGWSQLDTTAITKVGALLWDDGNRESAILDLCKANSVEVLFDRTGMGVLRPVPVLTDTSPSVYTIDTGARGVQLSADRTRDRSRIANVIIGTTAATDVTFDPVVVANRTEGDPLSIYGPLDYRAYDLTSAAFRNSDQAEAACRTELAKRLGVAKQLTLSAAGNPALDSADVVTAVLSRIDRNTPRPTELHILDTVFHPFAPSGTQQLSTRSTRPDTDGT